MPLKFMPEISSHTELDWQERALHYGDGLFETLLKLDGELPLWQAHFERLERGCNRLSIPAPDQDWLYRQIIAKSRDLEPAIIKVIVSRGRAGRGIQLPPADQNSVFVFSYPWRQPASCHHAKLCDTRLPINPNLAGLKHLNRLDYVLAAIELQQLPSATEGILCDTDGFLVEGLVSNLFFSDGDQLLTPTLEFAGVDGIMRQKVIEYCQAQQIGLSQGRYSTQKLFAATECFLCNSVRGITPVVTVDEHNFDIGPITLKLMSALNLTATIA